MTKKKETARSLSKSSCSGSMHDFPPAPLLFNRKCNIPAFALINSLLYHTCFKLQKYLIYLLLHRFRSLILHTK